MFDKTRVLLSINPSPASSGEAVVQPLVDWRTPLPGVDDETFAAFTQVRTRV